MGRSDQPPEARVLGAKRTSYWAIFVIFGKNSYYNAVWITFGTFLEPFEKTKFLRLKAN